METQENQQVCVLTASPEALPESCESLDVSHSLEQLYAASHWTCCEAPWNGSTQHRSWATSPTPTRAKTQTCSNVKLV